MDESLFDRTTMQRCIALSVESGEAGEYPYGAVIVRDGKPVAESINRIVHEKDVTRHAEVVAISAAQRALGSVSLDDCTIYVSAESCAYCCYAIRESRIGRVVYGLRSPHMGGVSKWPILPDEDLSNTMSEVFAAPPEIVAGFMAAEAEEALLKYNPVSGGMMKLRGLFVAGPVEKIGSVNARRRGVKERTFAFLRRTVFDRFGRS